ncbi:merozoite surface protein 7 [Plasmodium ovale wallikeri]|uniref:Merozoite surface protein 7 n=2 Tax=Plasmodium ovale TaxID=36330 RepID=A0A1A8ZB23_PLAOA|nr:merozoite surface protein 7 [Plasmodium ovale wallikeri]SBT41071.1 merozoite surface protein 7 [Plasmodium ovale wallikeri]SBT78082.1 MSP7-like protein, putative [Plasmodium ovale]
MNFISGEKNENFEEDVINMLKEKLGNVYNIGPNNTNDVNNIIELFKRQIEEMHMYKKKHGTEDIGQKFLNELDVPHEEKKKIFGVDEDDLDNYDEDFLGQSKTIIKGEEDDQGEDDSDEEGPSEGDSGEGDPGEDGPSGDPPDGPPALSEEDENDEKPDAENPESYAKLDSREATAPGAAGDNVVLGKTEKDETKEEHTPNIDGSLPGETQRKETVLNPQPEGPQVNQQERSPSAVQTTPSRGGATTNKHTDQTTSKATAPEVKYLKNLYDDILGETNQDSAVNTLKRHSNYNDIKKEHALPMSSKEYAMVKKLFGDCFKKGSDDNANATCVINVFTKMLDDKAFRQEFENVVNGIYGFAKRNSYLNEERWTGENANNAFFKNVVNMMNTL